MSGTVNGDKLQAVLLSFYMARLMQFFFSTIKGLQMYQSNLTCVVLSVIALYNMGFNMSAIQGFLMIFDAYIGAFLFVLSKNIEVSSLFEVLPVNVSAKI
jgi:hypothetical protein